MKKIVALVLALVMVLGLATTAFAVDFPEGPAKTYEKLFSKTTDKDPATASDVTVEYYAAAAPEYSKDGKTLEVYGCIAFYVVDDAAYVKVATVNDADLVIYKDAAMKSVFMYLDAIENPFYVGTGKAFKNFGDECGQSAYDYDKKDGKYYTFNKGYYEAVEASDTQLMVGDKLVPVAAFDPEIVKHTAAYTSEDGEVIAVECSACGLKAVYAKNFMSVPEGAEYVEIAGEDGYWYWAVAAAPADDATVESPKTFDAGIAMYVGMSVMAAAGSAVVLKKKD